MTAHPLLEIPDELKPAWGEYTILGYGGEALEITDTGIKAGLDFSGVRHYTFVPWEAVVGIMLPPWAKPSPPSRRWFAP